jgi:hypothetical protein
MTTKPLLMAASLAFVVSLSASPARAVELGGRFGMGAGLAVGTTDRGESRSSGSGLGFDVSGRLFAGPAVVGGSATVVPGLLGPTDMFALGGAGAKLELGPRWRLTSMFELGIHRISGLGKGLFAKPTSDGSAALPCWAANLSLEQRGTGPARAGLGVSLFFLADRERRVQDVAVSGLISSRSERHETGGMLGGVMVRALFGS